MNKKHTFKVGKYISMACLLFVCATVQSCRDEYYYDDREPEWLGASIYEYLESEGNFKYFMRVIDDLGRKDELSRTGSKTLFVADDDAFIAGVKKEWGYEGTPDEVYSQLTTAQKKFILYSAMLDNAYLLELMSNMPSSNANSEPVIGRCLRQVTSLTPEDTVPYFNGENLPQNNVHWDEFRQGGLRLALDGTRSMMVHFLEEQLYQNQISLDDVKCLLNYPDSISITSKDAFIFDKMVIDQNVTCKNGYVHQLDGLLLPPSNMAEEIRTNGETNIYSRMLDRFAVPVYNSSLTANYNRVHHYGDPASNEYVYEKRYWTSGTNRGGSGDFVSYVDRNEVEHSAEGSLYFDPGWNEYRPGENSSTQKENDMAVMFAPSDGALESYFRDGAGRALIQRYGSNVPDAFESGLRQAIDSIPLDVLQNLLRNMMKNSFNSAVPSRFTSIMNDARDPMGVEKDHVEKCIIANNGVVYVTNHVYSPARYVAVTAPVMLNDVLRIPYWGMLQKEYDKYLLSMGSTFSLMVPSEEQVKFLDLTTLKDLDGARMYVLKWKEGNVTDEKLKVYAEEWLCDPETLDTVKYIGSITNASNSVNTQIENIIKELYEYNIVVGDFNHVPEEYTGMMPNKYHMTKGYGTVKVNHALNNEGKYEVTAVAGGYQVEKGEMIPVGETYNQENGKTYRLDAGNIQAPRQSVSKVLSDSVNHPEFAEFYNLCAGSPDVLSTIYPSDSVARYQIFTSKNGAWTCMDQNVSTFNTYHYTVYVPTNEAINGAYDAGLPRWEDLEVESDTINEHLIRVQELMQELDEIDESAVEEIAAKQAEIDTLNKHINIEKMNLRAKVELVVAFVKYHFQDNSVYVDNLPHYIIEGNTKRTVVDYETATLDEVTKRFCTVTVETQDHGYGPTISVKGDIAGMDNTCYVINDPGKENRNYNIMTRDIWFKGRTIETSSFAVVHQIEAGDDGLGFLVNDRIFNAETGEFIIK